MRAMSDAAERAAELREHSDELNRAMHAEGISDADRDAIASEKRAVDAEAFDFEEQVRGAAKAVDDANPDAVHAVVLVPPISMNGGEG